MLLPDGYSIFKGWAYNCFAGSGFWSVRADDLHPLRLQFKEAKSQIGSCSNVVNVGVPFKVFTDGDTQVLARVYNLYLVVVECVIYVDGVSFAIYSDNDTFL